MRTLLTALTLIASCATGGGYGETLQLSSTCSHACVPGMTEPDPQDCCYDVDGYGWSGCAWNACGWDETCRKSNTHWDEQHPIKAPCGATNAPDGHMVPAPCRHPDGRVLVPPFGK